MKIVNNIFSINKLDQKQKLNIIQKVTFPLNYTIKNVISGKISKKSIFYLPNFFVNFVIKHNFF